MGAGGCDVRLYFVSPSERGDGVGEKLSSRIHAGGVASDAVGVKGSDLAGYSDAVDRHGIRPGVAGELGGEVAGEVGPVCGVAGDVHDGQLLEIQQPYVAVVIGADGDQQRVGRRLVGHVRSELVEVDGGNGCVAPSPDTVRDGSYAPFSRPLYVYVKAEILTRPEVQEFMRFYIANAIALVADVGFVDSPSDVYVTDQSRLEDVIAGNGTPDGPGAAEGSPTA